MEDIKLVNLSRSSVQLVKSFEMMRKENSSNKNFVFKKMKKQGTQMNGVKLHNFLENFCVHLHKNNYNYVKIA